MASYNRVIIGGNLTRDPEYKQLSSGQPVCRLGLASNRQYRNRQTGEMVQEVCFVDIDVWGAQADSCNQYLQKGRPILVEGRLKFDSWDDASTGQKRSRHTIVADRVIFLSSQEFAAAERTTERPAQQKQGLNPNNPVEKKLMDQIDEIKANVSKPAPKAAPKKAAAPKPEAPKTGEIDFKDEPPFQDDLPF